MAELTLEAAAMRLGISVDAVRRRIKRGRLSGQMNAEGRIVVVLPDEPEATTTYKPLELSGDPLETAGVVEAHLRELLTAAERRHEDLRRHIDSLEGQNAMLVDRLAAAESGAAELRQLLLQAQLQVQALIPKLPAPGETTQEQEQPRRTWWRWW